jgi:hypothetical protein
VLQAHNRFIQTKEEINGCNSTPNLEAMQNESITQQNVDGNSTTAFSMVDINSNGEKMKDVETGNESILIDCTRTSSLKGV